MHPGRCLLPLSVLSRIRMNVRTNLGFLSVYCFSSLVSEKTTALTSMHESVEISGTLRILSGIIILTMN